MLMGTDQVSCHINFDFFVAKCYSCSKRDQPFQIITVISGLFFQFSCRTVSSRFICLVQPSCWKLQCKAVQCIPVLSYHQESAVIHHRNHSSSPFVVDIVPHLMISIGKLHIIFVYINNCSLIYPFSFYTFDFFFHPFSSSFSHNYEKHAPWVSQVIAAVAKSRASADFGSLLA